MRIFQRQRPQLIIFDLDGTLVDSVPDLAYSVDCAMQMLDMPVHGEEKIRTWVGLGAEKLIIAALTDGDLDAEVDPSLFQKAFDLFSHIYGQNKDRRSLLYEGVHEVLRHFQSLKIPLACVTNKYAQYTEPLMKALEIQDYFSVVISGDTLTRKKPHPDPLLHVAKLLNVAPDNCLMVGDSISDLDSARAAGMPVICVSYGYNHGRDISDAKPDKVIHSLLKMKEIFP